MADRRVRELAQALYAGRVARRDFVRGMAALGVSATATRLFLKGAAAQSDNGFATPDPAGDAAADGGQALLRRRLLRQRP